ncbi:hypothetical protein [uncultured Cardiobacterium sp.]|uniref:hypothetical protein n=1 Tax=uncultured Cardiobacterium sp. TaxID=417619 RepID=UPI002612FA2A|nr:hypothetical protein [uncultured Cardiobacterium sp.]
MARLTPEQWEKVRVDHEVNGMSFSELERKYGVNNSNISRRAKKEGWNQTETQNLITATVENEKEKLALRRETQKLNAETQRAVQEAVFDRLAFELQSNADFQAVRDKAMGLLAGTDKIGEVKQVADVLQMQRKAMLGDGPAVAVQVNNNAPQRIERVVVDADPH